MMEVERRARVGARQEHRPAAEGHVHLGLGVTFKAVPDTLSVQYTLFRPDGAPLRAQAKLSLIQVEKAQDKSAERGSAQTDEPDDARRSGIGAHVFATATAWLRSHSPRYGDPTLWRAIAEANGIDDPLASAAGRRSPSRGASREAERRRAMIAGAERQDRRHSRSRRLQDA